MTVQWLQRVVLAGAVALTGCFGSSWDEPPSDAATDSGRGEDGGSGKPNAGDIDGGTPTGDGSMMSSGAECAAKAKEACEHQKQCDPIGFALDWDGDINQFCIPKRKAACEAGLFVTSHRAAGEACDQWVRASCENYRNFYYRVTDSSGKWAYGNAACESDLKPARGSKSESNDCSSDYECNDGLFCRTANDDFRAHGKPGVEYVCGKCAPQYAYDGPNTHGGYSDPAVVPAVPARAVQDRLRAAATSRNRRRGQRGRSGAPLRLELLYQGGRSLGQRQAVRTRHQRAVPRRSDVQRGRSVCDRARHHHSRVCRLWRTLQPCALRSASSLGVQGRPDGQHDRRSLCIQGRGRHRRIL